MGTGQTAERFGLGRELREGRFVRQQSTFRDRVTADGSSGHPAVAGRYHLYVARACPWSHRTILVRRLMGLERAISVSYAHPLRDQRGWRFPGGDFSDDVNGFEFLAEAYRRTDPRFDGRVSVPVLWDREGERIVNNDSSDVMRDLAAAFAGEAEHPVELVPDDLVGEIDALNEHLYDNVNNAVYEAGFATDQAAYEAAFDKLFEALDGLEERLAERRWLFGERLTESDLRLFCTLVRFDAVYHYHFRCNRQRLIDFPNLFRYTRELYAVPGVAETVALDEIKRHYYGTHPMLNPSGIVPKGPRLAFA